MQRRAVVFARAASIFTAAGVSIGGCASTPKAPEMDDLSQLTAWMTGSFSSADQAATDPENYRDIRLEMKPIWPERDDGPWLYVEQAAASSLEKPYRQRVYRLSKGAARGTFTSSVYELPGDPLVYAGAWKTPELLASVTPEQLQQREGCTIVLTRESSDAFAGSTVGSECISTLRGAAYATSEVTITAERLVSWDRGFDASGTQVWGAEKGGYVFEKVGRESN